MSNPITFAWLIMWKIININMKEQTWLPNWEYRTQYINNLYANECHIATLVCKIFKFLWKLFMSY